MFLVHPIWFQDPISKISGTTPENYDPIKVSGFSISFHWKIINIIMFNSFIWGKHFGIVVCIEINSLDYPSAMESAH